MEPMTTTGLWLGLAAGVITDPVPGSAPPWAGGRVELAVDDVFGVQLSGDFMPHMGYRGPVYRQIVQQIDPLDDFARLDISPVVGHLSLAPTFTPIRGQLYLPTHALFDVRLFAGPGLVWTRDDLLTLDKAGEPSAVATERQVHPTIEIGAGTSVQLSAKVRAFTENRFIAYVETVESTELITRTRWLPGLGVRVAL